MFDQEHTELIKTEVLELYNEKCKARQVTPHRAFVRYLEETYDENDAIEIVIKGNDKLNFSNRIDDKALLAICATLERYPVYIEDIDLRYNEITCAGAKALASLIARSQRLLGLNL